MVVIATAVTVLLAWGLGWLSLRRGGIYFSILTLAFAQMMFYMASSVLANYPGTETPLTNGENGFTDVSVDPLLGMFSLSSEMPSVLGEFVGTWHYGFFAVCTFLAIVVAYRILNSPYGLVFKAIRENEQRTEFVGLHVWRYKLMSFILSGTFAGVAGALFTVHGSYVPLESLYWTASGEVVVMTVLGGAGSLFGPIFGAAVYLWVENIVSGMETIGPFWHLILGLVFVLVIVLVPDGIWGLPKTLRKLWGRITSLGGGD
jgi:branched-chain amino acid transport system permease protein